jgi:hypothetical protein
MQLAFLRVLSRSYLAQHERRRALVRVWVLLAALHPGRRLMVRLETLSLSLCLSVSLSLSRCVVVRLHHPEIRPVRW